MDKLIQDFSILSVSERKYCLSLMKAQTPSISSTFYSSWFESNSSGISNFRKILTNSSLDIKSHQIEGVQWLLNKELENMRHDEGQKRPVGGILADEMGLGKTLQIIGVIACNFKFKTLIVVPCALLDQWIYN